MCDDPDGYCSDEDPDGYLFEFCWDEFLDDEPDDSDDDYGDDKGFGGHGGWLL